MITFVYFDIGGVVLDDFSGNDKWQELKREIGVTDQNEAAFDKLWKRYWPELDTTRDVDSLQPILEQELGLHFPDGYSLLRDGFVKRFYANPLLWPILKQVKQQAKIGLLTNMYPRMFAEIERRNVLPPITWDIIVDSSQERIKKPDPRLLEIAQKRAGVPGAEILFIDNMARNTEPAKAFGWQVFLYDPSDHKASCQALLEKLQAERLL